MNMRAFALVLPCALALAACGDKPPQPIPTDPSHPGANPDCKYETQSGECVPGCN